MIENALYFFVTLLLLTFATGKECGKGYGSCPDNQCCSKYGYCGRSEDYCGSGCQSEFGSCGDIIVDNAVVVEVSKSNTRDRNEVIDSAEVIEVKKSTRINTTKKRSSSTTKKRTSSTTKKRTSSTTTKKRTTSTTTTKKRASSTTTKKRTSSTTTKKRTTSTTSKKRTSSTTSLKRTSSTTSIKRTSSTTKRRTSSTTKRSSSTTERTSSSIKRTLPTIKSTLISTKKRTVSIKRKTIIITKIRKSSTSSVASVTTTKQLPTTTIDEVSTPSYNEDISTSIVNTTTKEVPTTTNVSNTTSSESIEEKENETTATTVTKSSTSVSVPTHGHSHDHTHGHIHGHDHSHGCSFKTIAHLFNAFFFGDFKGFNSDIQGRLAAKGTVDISGGFQNGAFNFNPATNNKMVKYYQKDDKINEDIPYTIVAGDVLFRDNGEILNGGVAYQNEVKLPSFIKEALERQNYPIKKSSFIDFDKEKQSIVAHSQKLGAMKENTKVKEENGKLVIDLVPGQKIYVIKITDLNKYWDIQVNENNVNLDDVTIIFNLVSDNVVFTNFDISGLKKYASRILWNASNANKVKIQNFRIQGSLLAPNADIEGTNGNIQGQIIGKSFKGNLQIDWVPFNGFN